MPVTQRHHVSLTGPGGDVVQRLLDDVLHFQGGDASDDIALVVAAVPGS